MNKVEEKVINELVERGWLLGKLEENDGLPAAIKNGLNIYEGSLWLEENQTFTEKIKEANWYIQRYGVDEILDNFMNEKGYESLRSQYSWRHIFEKMNEVYNDIEEIATLIEEWEEEENGH